MEFVSAKCHLVETTVAFVRDCSSVLLSSLNSSLVPKILELQEWNSGMVWTSVNVPNGSWRFLQIQIPSNLQKNGRSPELHLEMKKLSGGDPDLYIAANRFPTFTSNDGHETSNDSGEENPIRSINMSLVSLPDSESGKDVYIVGVYGYCCVDVKVRIRATVEKLLLQSSSTRADLTVSPLRNETLASDSTESVKSLRLDDTVLISAFFLVALFGFLLFIKWAIPWIDFTRQMLGFNRVPEEASG